MFQSSPIIRDITPPGEGVQALLTNSYPLDLSLASRGPAARETVGDLCGAIESLGRKRSSSAYKALRRFVDCFAVNVFAGHVISPGRYVAVPLRLDHYSDTRFTHSAVTAAMAGLGALGYVVRHAYYWDPKGKAGMVTRFEAMPKLADLFKDWDLGAIDSTERSPLVEIRPRGALRRRAARAGEAIPATLPWPATARLDKARMTKNIRVLNAALAAQFQALAIPDTELRDALRRNRRPVTLYQANLHRVFTDDPQHGGRFVGPWYQSINPELRQHIRMGWPNSAPTETVEIDFDSIHPTMLYATKKFPVNGDLYAIYPNDARNKALRPAIKWLLLKLINAASETKAKNSFKKKINTVVYPKWLRETYDAAAPSGSPWDNVDSKLATMYLGSPTLEQLVADIKSHHYRIADSLGTGAGRALMYQDSQIAEAVMLSIWREYRIVPLPVHDSFIVPIELERPLRAAMELAFASRFAGITPATTIKRRTEKPYTLTDTDLYTKLSHYHAPMRLAA